MPGFGEPVQNNLPALSGLILDLEVAQVKGVGVFDNIDGRNSLNGGGKIATSRCSGFIAIVKDDGSGNVRAYQYIGPDAGNDYVTDEYVSDDDWTNLSYWQEVGGGTGTQGLPGDDGITYTPVVGSVSASDPGSTPVVTIGVATTSATEGVATFNFVLPRGDEGPQGAPGATGNDGTTFTPVISQVDTLNPGSAATASVNAANGEAQFTFGIPAGSVGPEGPQGPQGTQGTQGTAGENGTTFTPVAVANTLEPGSAATATVTSSEAEGVATYTFGIPRGETGAQGATGPAGSISELTNVVDDPVASSFLFAPSGTTYLTPHSFTGATGVDIVVSGTAVTTELDFSELPQATANGGSALYEILTESNGGRGIEIVAYDADQGEVTVSYYNILANLANLIVVDAVENDPNTTLNDYGGTLDPADVDGDGTIGVNDLLEVLALFGNDAIVNGLVEFKPLNSTSMSTADPVLYSILDFDGVSPGTKVYFPIDQEGEGDSFYVESGSFDINISGTGLTDGTGYVEFLSGSGGSAPINANTNKNGIALFDFRIWAKTESGEAVITSGFDYEYLTSSNTSIASGSHSASFDTVNVDGIKIIPDTQQVLSQAFVDHMVSTHASDGFSYSADGSLNVPSTLAKIRVKPWFSCNSQDVRLYTGTDTQISLTSFDSNSRLSVKFYRTYAI